MVETIAFDTVIVGGGTAGCVLANRLSADGGQTVALVEAGPDFGPADSGNWPPALAGANYVQTEYDWGYRVSVGGREQPYTRGKVIGGSSTVNACGINLGIRQDYDAWAALGNPGWGFDGLLPYFQQVERFVNDDPPLRGRTGQLVVTRAPGGSPFLADLERAYANAGLMRVRDVAGPDAVEGVGESCRNTLDGVRYHAAAAYLDPARARGNLTILDRTEVVALDWAGRRVAGLWAVRNGERALIRAGRIVLAAGAVGSPLILQRSGIGPARLLRQVLGDAVAIHDLPGVGRNLHDHYGARAHYQAAVGAYERLAPAGTGAPRPPRISLVARLKSDPALAAFDLDFIVSHWGARPSRRDEESFQFTYFLVHPVATGQLEVVSPDPAIQPNIETGYGPAEDIEAIARGIEWGRSRVQDPVVADWFAEETVPGRYISGAGLRDWVRRSLVQYHHPTGTCKLGPADDPLAVVDATGRVYGLDNLYVADASIMPTIPRGMINLTVYAVAEKIAAGLAGNRS